MDYKEVTSSQVCHCLVLETRISFHMHLDVLPMSAGCHNPYDKRLQENRLFSP